MQRLRAESGGQPDPGERQHGEQGGAGARPRERGLDGLLLDLRAPQALCQPVHRAGEPGTGPRADLPARRQAPEHLGSAAARSDP